MKNASSARKTARNTGRNTVQRNSAGPDGIAIAPPAYGIDIVDREPLQSATAEAQEHELPAPIVSSHSGPVQRKSETSSTDSELSKVQKENKTGLPNNLKAGIENLSGLSMDDVKVHYNSSKPAQLRAHAYARGSDIHLGPGHEQHLPHEAWHVVQQKQGRVKPSLQMKGIAVNADLSLENEADIMGSKALGQITPNSAQKKHSTPTSDTIQPWWPKGHREITKKAFEFYDNDQKLYAKDVQEYLIARSPDMDFAQDEVNSMEEGIKKGEATVERMKKYMEDKKTYPQALRIWNDNEIHHRPKWYATHHGEGGQYKEGLEKAASINEAITKGLVSVALSKYNGGAKEAGLSVLSDALHQAEDRGAHMEGEEFKGHDSRMTVKVADRPRDGKKADAKSLPYRENTTYTDNAAENTDGAKKAIKLAIDAVFKPFLEGIEAGKVEMGDGKEKPSVRRSKFKGKAGTVSESGALKAKYPGKTSEKVIRGITETQIKDYDLPKTRKLLDEEAEYVKGGISRYQDVWIIAELTERIRQQDKAKYTFEDRCQIGYKELEKLLKEPGWFDTKYKETITKEKKTLWVEQAAEQLQYQRNRGDVRPRWKYVPFKGKKGKKGDVLPEPEV